jgi:hypothetical protein
MPAVRNDGTRTEGERGTKRRTASGADTIAGKAGKAMPKQQDAHAGHE